MVVKRFLAVFYPPAEYRVSTRITRVEEEPFKTEGKVLLKPGWLAVYGRESQEDEESRLVAVQSGERVVAEEIALNATETRPPPRYSEATLLSAMEGAGKMVDDEELKAAMEGRGLGTPATRAQIIENLIGENYIHREGRELHPTAKAFSLMTLLNGLGIPELTAPELTGEWEHKLARMERGELSRDDFMKEIAAMTQHIVDCAKSYDNDSIPGDFGELATPCPKCGGKIQETYKKFQCQGCDFSLWKIVAEREYKAEEIEQLLSKRVLGPLSGFRNKMGRSFSAIIRLNGDFRPEFVFDQEFGGEDSDEEVDFSWQEALGKCPKCASRVFEYGSVYLCEKAVGKARSCDFRSGKIILQQPVDRAQMTRLLTTGKTELLTGFVSVRTRRKFSAFLVRGADGKIGFEFGKKAPRQEPAAGRKAKAEASGKNR
jgi:DNA topoisomerase-3